MFFLLYTYLVYCDIPEHRSLTAAVILLAHTPEFVTALELSIESKRESASDLEQYSTGKICHTFLSTFV